jgi:DNA processing protein
MTSRASPSHAAYATALATLDGLGPRALFRLLQDTSPGEAWARLDSGTSSGVPRGTDRAALRAQLRGTDVGAVWEVHRAAGVGVTWAGCPTYPPRLREDPAAPGVVFHLGDPAVLDAAPSVAVVGTRSATRYGLGVAAQLGAELAASGVSVVSGLALGIDGAAHEGACAGCAAAGDAGGPPVGVVAGGLDAPYPVRHAGLWQRVAASGVIVTTSPVGTPLSRGRFPQRNRLIGALCDVAVVVESHHAGGALSTALEALDRGRPVGAVPGSIRSPASAGANDLLHDGAFVVRDVGDVEMALGLVRSAAPPRPRGSRPTFGGWSAATRTVTVTGPTRDTAVTAPRAGAVAPTGTADGDLVVEALGAERCSLDQLARRTGLDLPRLCVALEVLATAGRLVGEGGWWEHV